MANLKIYDADQYSLIVVGVSVETGLNDGPFLKVEAADDAFKSKVCVDGEVIWSKTNNPLVKLTLTTMQTSDANPILSAIHELDKKTPGGTGVGTWMIRDRQGTTVLGGRFSRIMKAPDITLDREATERDWEIAAIVDERLDGNN